MSDASFYEPPPVPPGISPEAAYTAQVYASGTRAILVDAQRRHQELLAAVKEEEAGAGVGGWLSARLGALPGPLQTSLALGMMYLALQLGGAAYEKLVGHPPPQPTQPVLEASPATTDGP